MSLFRLLIAAAFCLILNACGQEPGATDAGAEVQVQAESAAAEPPDSGCQPTPVADPSSDEIVPGLNSKVLTQGCGDTAAPGHTVVVHYTGWLYDESAPNNRGNKFDSSRDRDQRFSFPLGAGRVIQGWDKGVAGMAIGEVRELTIAPELAYGDRNAGAIPPGSTLIFEVELFNLVGKPK